MADITINVPDPQASRVLDAFAARFGWTAASGLTKAQFAKRQLADYARGIVRQYEAQQAYEQAEQKADSEVDIT